MAPNWRARHGMTSAEFKVESDGLAGQGYRLLDICGYRAGGGDANYAAVWEQTPGPEWVVRHHLSSAEHQALFGTLPGQGYRPVRVSGYEIGSSAAYASIWHRSGGVVFDARHGLTVTELQRWYDHHSQHGFRPVDVCGYVVDGQTRYTAIWENSSIPSWAARHDLTSGEYQEEFRRLTRDGFLPWSVSGYEVDGQVRYAAIWVKGPAVLYSARHDMTPADYQNEVDALGRRGFRPARVSAFPTRNGIRFAAIWHKPYLSGDDERVITNAVSTFMTTHRMPGLSLALAKDERLVLAQGFGNVGDASGTAVTPRHLFRIASVAKPITAVAVFRLIATGRLGLDDLVFGATGRLGTRYGTQPYAAALTQMTVRHLLEHTSGWAGRQDPMFDHTDLDRDALINWMLAHQTPVNSPGTSYDYLNFGYCLLGRVIEAVTGETYEAFTRREVLAPGGITTMRVAGDSLADRQPDEVQYVSQGVGDPYNFRVSRMDSHGGWLATPTDLVRFLVRVDGFPRKPDILPADQLAAMVTAGAANPNYAKGWWVKPGGNRFHEGDLPGTSAIAVRTSDGHCWAVLANSRRNPVVDLDTMRIDLDNVMWTIVRGVTDWPAYDLF